jgi:KaiC/GvpD/RAD55 family RecA-like ATPase
VSQEKSSTAEELNRKLDLIIKRIDTLESVIVEDPEYAELAAFLNIMKSGIGLYKNPLKIVANSQRSEKDLEGDPSTGIQIRLSPQFIKTRVGEEVNIMIKITNQGKAPVHLKRIENFIPQEFEMVSHPDYCRSQNNNLETNKRMLGPLSSEEIKINMMPSNKGSYLIDPTIIFTDASGRQFSNKPEPININVLETILPDRISTGYKDLDSILFGGVPKNYAIILTAPSSDERDLLIKRFINEGIKKRHITFWVTADSSALINLSNGSKSNLYLFICNPHLDTNVETNVNLIKLQGVENLTNIRIEISKTLRTLGPASGPRRACIEILSDVLLQHKAIQTRKWLNNLISELKSKGFTTITTMNPKMHSQQEIQAILDLFDGEISIQEIQRKRESIRQLEIKRLHSRKYLSSTITLRRNRLQS